MILYTDSEEIDEDEEGTKSKSSEEQIVDEYTIEFHIKDKPENIVEMFSKFHEAIKDKIEIIPTKHYIGFYKASSMFFSCVVMKKSIVFYSRALPNELSTGFNKIKFRDVRNIGHYTNHLPTEVILTDISQLEELLKYFNSIYEKY